jgi:hypothetical protein
MIREAGKWRVLFNFVAVAVIIGALPSLLSARNGGMLPKFEGKNTFSKVIHIGGHLSARQGG